MTLPVRASFSLFFLAILLALPQAAQGPRIRFTDVASSTGLASFVNVSGTPTKDFITDANGNGVAFFDYDNDRDLDVLLVNGSTLQALLKGGVHRLFVGNLKAGDHELIALFTGQGPHVRDYRRGATLKINKGVGAKYVELKISDRASKAQPARYARQRPSVLRTKAARSSGSARVKCGRRRARTRTRLRSGRSRSMLAR